VFLAPEGQEEAQIELTEIWLQAKKVEDVERLVLMRAAQQRQGGKGGSLGIATKEFCLVGALPSGPLLVTVYLLTSETRSYVVITNDLDLGKEPAVAEELSKLKPC